MRAGLRVKDVGILTVSYTGCAERHPGVWLLCVVGFCIVIVTSSQIDGSTHQ